MHDLRLVLAFAFHTIMAVLLFALVGGAAALLHTYIGLLEKLHMPWLIIESIKLAEYFLFAADLLCLVVYVSREVYVLVRAMLTQAQPDPTPATGLPR